MENKCVECDFYINNKQKGFVCLNPDSENFNQNVDKDNGCDKYWQKPKQGKNKRLYY